MNTDFNEWVKLREEFSPAQMGTAEMGGPGIENQVDDMQIKPMLKKRINMLFDELNGYNISRMRAIQILAVILQEFQEEFKISPAGMRQALKQATVAPPAPVDPMA